MAGHCPFPAYLLSRGTVTRILLPVSATFGKNEEVSEVLKFKRALRQKRQLRGTDPGKCLAEGRMQRAYLGCCSRGIL